MNRYGYSSVGRFDVFFRDQLLMFRQHQDESLYDSWTRFKDIIQKVPNHGLSIWTLIEIFLKHLDSLSRHIINLTAEGDLRKFSDIGAWDDMVRVQVPRCMAWLDYDEHVDSLSTMDNEVGVTSPESTTQTLPSFEEYTPPVTYPEEVEKTLGTPIEVEPLNETKLEEVGLNCNHNTPLSSREVPSFDGPEPQPLLNSPSLDVSLGDVIGPEPPIKPHSPDSSRMKEMFDDDWGLESKKVSPLGEELSLFDRPNKVEKGRILEAHRLEPIFQQQISQRIDPSHHDAGRLLGAYDLGFATPRAMVHAGDKTSGDARSWYMISGDAKSWVCDCLHIFTVILHNCPTVEILAQRLGFLQTYELTNIIVDVFECHFQVKRMIVKVEMYDSRL
ncbi:hypothetical protein Tco_1083005 [Tanacetum coccineum]|uniref:Retrotransposon gag domain-containing protein n=1 Tax=Tanacetum coccineum TaxID=301880 RepID=A0ABQ5I267_9ASTR